MKDFRKYFGGLERDFGFCNVNNGYHDPQTNKLKFVFGLKYFAPVGDLSTKNTL